MAHPLVELLLALVPPSPEEDNPMKSYRWRLKSVGLGIACLVLGAYDANFVPGLHPAYAMAEDVKKNNDSFKDRLDEMNRKWEAQSNQVNTLIAQNVENQKQTLTTNLIEATRYKCRADNAGDDSSKSFWTRRWLDLKSAYRSLTGQPWEEVPCKSF